MGLSSEVGLGTVIPLPRTAIHYSASIFHSVLPEMQISPLLFILGFQIYGNPEIWGEMPGPQRHSICLFPLTDSFPSLTRRVRGAESGIGVPAQKRAPQGEGGRGQLLNRAPLFEPQRPGVSSLIAHSGPAITPDTGGRGEAPNSPPEWRRQGDIPAFDNKNLLSTYYVPRTTTH